MKKPHPSWVRAPAEAHQVIMARSSSAHPRASGGPERVPEGAETSTLDARLRGHERWKATAHCRLRGQGLRGARFGPAYNAALFASCGRAAEPRESRRAQGIGVPLAAFGRGDDALSDDLANDVRLAPIVQRSTGFLIGRAEHLDRFRIECRLLKEIDDFGHEAA